ncbi:hypothetical protein G7046_g7276 [Stylonectria norvegica]|nr:hypothetical protein G7046_g7276 [Stylonectria norvegica]
MSPPENKAIFTTAAGVAEILPHAYPTLPSPEFLIVKTTAVAVNPTDWKHVTFEACVGTVVGCDYAGVVVEVGSGVTKDFKVGDRITGMVNGSNPLSKPDGTFAQYIAVKEGLQIKTPDNVSDEEAATLGIAVTTSVSRLLKPTSNLPTYHSIRNHTSLSANTPT